MLYKHTKLVLDNLRIGEARSEHLHIVAPDGVEFVKDPHLIENETKRPVQELKKTSRYRSKTTPEQVSIYTNTTLTDSDRFDVALAMQPAVKGLILNLLFAFPLSALIPLVLLAGLLFSSPCIETAFLSSGFRGLASYAVEYAGDLVGLEGLLGVFTHTVSLEDQTMPYLTLMNFVPVVVLGIVLKNEDHFMRRNMLHWARRAIQTSIGVSLLATTFLAAGLVLFVPLMAVAVIFNIVFWAATIAQFYVFQSRRKYIRRSAATTKLLKPVMVRRERQQA
ncbi:MAG: hypothetical protein LBD25_06265 [Coriobacteriales bacterium]|nr:hypothetical protein [Coriobacteriales bacterium]